MKIDNLKWVFFQDRKIFSDRGEIEKESWFNKARIIDPNGNKIPPYKWLFADTVNEFLLGYDENYRSILTSQNKKITWNHFPNEIKSILTKPQYITKIIPGLRIVADDLIFKKENDG